MLFQKMILVLVMVALGCVAPLHAVEENSSAPPEKSQGGFLAAEQAIKGFDVPKGFNCEVVAADPLFGNPVSFSIDEQGRFYIAETFRLEKGVPDIRQRMHWLDAELASKSVGERIGYTERFEPKNNAWWTNNEDRVSLIWDSDGDGQCDKSSVFAGKFNALAEGIGAGVLARHGSLYYADIPNLWLLRDTDHDGVADVRKSLSFGYGVRYGFLGHDLHGLCIGPDGRLYYSIGDRGGHVELRNGKVIDNSECGAVYRCELDGSNLEIVHQGLRNPQELAFDNHGNLWTCDNNSDAGDPARVVYVAEGGDSGWRIGWQFIQQPTARSSWLSERICYENFPGRAAYALPPVSSKVGNGPSGLAFDPGVGLPPEWRGRFFLANFSGNPNSGIFAFKVRPKGAGFELEQNDRFWWNFLPTDVDFGYDGCIYATDWINGWEGTGKGRLYRLFQPEQRNQPALAGLKRLFAEGFKKLSTPILVQLLAHEDRRVRLEVQFELVARKDSTNLTEVAARGPTLFARLHAIWGLGQMERGGSRADLKDLFADPEPEVRAQLAKILGDAKDGRFDKQLISLLTDSEPRVRYFAAVSLGALGVHKSVPPVLAMLRADDNDPWLRHAGVMALVGCASEAELAAMAKDASANVRLAATIALRRLASPKLEQFLKDKESLVVAEAARAINDLPIVAALPALAALADDLGRLAELPGGSAEAPGPRDAILRRVVNANLRIGTLTAQLRLASLIANEGLPEGIRVEAVTAFDEWSKPNGKDRVTGLWRPLAPRAAPDFNMFVAVLTRVLTGKSPEPVKAAVLATARSWRWKRLGEPALALLNNNQLKVKTRVAALEFLGAMDFPRLDVALNRVSGSKEEELRIAALRFTTKSMRGKQSVALFEKLLNSGTLRERQNVYALLGEVKDPAADRLLVVRLDELFVGRIAGELQLDLIEAAARRSDSQVKEKLGQFLARRGGQAGAGQFSECLVGGDADHGRTVFRESVPAACLRCHKLAGEGGDAAPDLTHIAARGNRNYIIESITFPNAKIAPGYQSAQVVLKNGLSNAGFVKRETDEELDLFSLEGGLVTIKKADIKTRSAPLSGMPDNLREVLTRREIRDLVEYLSGFK